MSLSCTISESLGYLSFGVVCVILRLAIWVQCRFVTGQTDRRTDGQNIVLCGVGFVILRLAVLVQYWRTIRLSSE